MKRNLHPNATPIEEKYIAFQDGVRETSWYDVYQTVPEYQTDPDVRFWYDEYRKVKRQGFAAANAWLQTAINEEGRKAMRAVDAAVSRTRNAYREGSAQFDAEYSYWFGTVPKTQEARRILERLRADGPA